MEIAISDEESGFCDNFGDPANIQAIADIVTDHDFFSADIAPNGPNFIYIVETPIDFSNEEVGDIDPLLLDVNDDGDNDGVDDNDEDDHDGVGDNDEDDHDGVGDNANESNDDNVSVSSEQSDVSLASTVLWEDYLQEFLEDIEE